MRFVKPIDIEMINVLAKNSRLFSHIRRECNSRWSGISCGRSTKFIRKINRTFTTWFTRLFYSQATQQEALEDLGLDTKGIEEKIINFIAKQDNL